MSALTRSPQELEQALLTVFADYGPTAVALSAGVDSTVVAAAAHRALGEQAVALTAVSPSLPAGEKEAAEQIARQIGIRHLLIETQEMQQPDYVRNPVNRCYYCKTELYQTIYDAAPRLNVTVLANGANLDDQGDHRPGMMAAREFSVRSPLIEAGFTKADVRELARHWNLPNWEKPAGPCLSSRIAYGVEVTAERLQRIDAAETWLRQQLQEPELRVRLEANEMARIEIPVTALPRACSSPLREQLAAEFHRLGFRYVSLDLDGFRSGSMNAVVPLSVWKRS